jgi:hypothetical protein
MEVHAVLWHDCRWVKSRRLHCWMRYCILRLRRCPGFGISFKIIVETHADFINIPRSSWFDWRAAMNSARPNGFRKRANHVLQWNAQGYSKLNQNVKEDHVLILGWQNVATFFFDNHVATNYNSDDTLFVMLNDFVTKFLYAKDFPKKNDPWSSLG